MHEAKWSDKLTNAAAAGLKTVSVFVFCTLLSSCLVPSAQALTLAQPLSIGNQDVSNNDWKYDVDSNDFINDDYDESVDEDVLTGLTAEKRAWNSGFSGSMGKRAWNSGFSGAMGKRAWNSGLNMGK